MKKIYFAIGTLLGSLVLIAGCGKPALETAITQGAKKLSSSQIREVVDGSTVTMEGGGTKATVEIRDNGSLSGTNSTSETDKGQWQVKDDELCLSFKKWGQGDSKCYQIVANNGGYQLYNRKGMLAYTLTVQSSGTSGKSVQQQAFEPRHSESPPPSPAPSAPASVVTVRELPSAEHPQAAADVAFILRQSAQNCPGCNLAGAKLSGQSLVGANLQGANLTEANLSHANLRRANLRGANLYRADLRQADLAGADLTGANLTDALHE